MVLLSALHMKMEFLLDGVTRGDGSQGDDVSLNLKTIPTIPLKLNGTYPDLFEIRGEIILPISGFNLINAKSE